MILGNNVEISLSVNDLKQSEDFYLKLGFNKINSVNSENDSIIYFIDGNNIISLRNNNFHFPVITYHVTDLETRISDLRIKGIKTILNFDSNGDIFSANVIAPDMQTIRLVNSDFSLKNKDTQIPGIGRLGFVSIEVEDIKHAERYWIKLGFKSLLLKNCGFPCGLYTDGNIIIGLHETDILGSNGLAYFTDDSKYTQKILRDSGIQYMNSNGNSKGLKYTFVLDPDGRKIFIMHSSMEEIDILKRINSRAS